MPGNWKASGFSNNFFEVKKDFASQVLRKCMLYTLHACCMHVQVQTSFHERQQTQQNHSQRTAEPGTVRKTKTPLAGENDTKTRLNLLPWPSCRLSYLPETDRETSFFFLLLLPSVVRTEQLFVRCYERLCRDIYSKRADNGN